MPVLTFYEKTNSWFEKLNPVSKLLFAGVMVVISFLTGSIPVLALYFWGVIGLSLTAGNFKRCICFLGRTLLPLFIFLFAMQSVLYPGGREILLTIGFLTIKKEGVLFASVISLRLLVVTASMIVFLFSTHPKNMVLTLEKKGMPPAAGYIILSTMQIIPQMERLAHIILDAQKSRGMEVEGGLRTRIKAYIPVMGPLILGSIAQLEDKALALEARAFNAPVQKTTMVDFQDTPADKIFRFFMVTLFITALVGRVAPLWL